MKKTLSLLILILSFEAQSQRHNDGPSTLEGEFSRRSHMRLPVNYSQMHGLSFDYTIPKNEAQVKEDDLFGDVTGLTVNFTPLAYASIEKYSRLVNLETGVSDSTEIQPADTNTGYLLIESRKWDLGIGLEGNIALPAPLPLVGAGFAYVKGKNYYSIRKLSHRHEKRPSLALPVNSENLRDWKVGDQIFYATRGGMVFNVFLGFKPLFSIGPEYTHAGSYRIKAHLLAENLMEVEVVTTHTDSISFEVSSLPAKVELAKSWGHLDSLVYQFDLSNPEATKAIGYIFAGRSDLTNREMLLANGKITLKTNLTHAGTNFSEKFGIPFVYINGGSWGVTDISGTIEKDNDEIKVYSTSYSHELFTQGLISHRKWFSEATVSTVLREPDDKNSVITSYYSWSFSKDKMMAASMYSKFRDLSRIFGTSKLTEIKLPAKKLGYLKADFGIDFSGKDVLHLLNTSLLKDVEKLAVESLEADFISKGHRAFCAIRSYENCMERHLVLIRNKHLNMRSKILELEIAYKKNEISKVTHALGEIMRLLFTSKYLTQSFVTLRPELKFELRLEGENIKKHVIRL